MSSFIIVFTDIFGHFDPFGVDNNGFLNVDPLGCTCSYAVETSCEFFLVILLHFLHRDSSPTIILCPHTYQYYIYGMSIVLIAGETNKRFDILYLYVRHRFFPSIIGCDFTGVDYDSAGHL